MMYIDKIKQLDLRNYNIMKCINKCVLVCMYEIDE